MTGTHQIDQETLAVFAALARVCNEHQIVAYSWKYIEAALVGVKRKRKFKNQHVTLM